MSTLSDGLSGVNPSDQQLRYVAAALAYVVAATHVFHPQRGLTRLVVVLTSGSPGLLVSDPRPLVFLLSGLAIFAAVTLVLLGYPRRPIYLAGMALMAAYLLGYFAWHMTGHGGFLPNRIPRYHGLGPIEAVVLHLRTYLIARVAVVAEVALLAVLGALYYREFRGTGDSAP